MGRLWLLAVLFLFTVAPANAQVVNPVTYKVAGTTCQPTSTVNVAAGGACSAGTLTITGGGSGPPTPTGVQYSVAYVENPAGTFVITPLTQDMIAPAFTAAISGAQTVEVGANIVNPSFTCAYNRTPLSASISDGIGHSVTLVTPFTSGTITNTYNYTTQTSVTETLTANGPPSKNASTTLAWVWRRYWGTAVDPGVYTSTWVKTTLTSTDLAGYRQKTIAYTAAAGEYLWYAYATVDGVALPSNFIDTATGFAAGFSQVSTTSVTNNLGQTTNYYLWRSDQTGLTITIQVT